MMLAPQITRKTHIILAALALLSGCVTDTWRLRDLTFVSAQVIDERDMPSSDERIDSPAIPPRAFLVVTFKSTRGKDLYRYADNSHYTMHTEASICSHGEFDPTKALEPFGTIYGDYGRVEQDNPLIANVSRNPVFHTYIDMSGSETCGVGGCKTFLYDLMKTPEDLCLYLDGGAFQILFPAFQSNLIVVPKSAVAAAIRNAHRHLE